MEPWLSRYLARIGLDHAPPVSAEGLRTIFQAQLRNIPFDGLDPLFGCVPDISQEAIQTKILDQGRGGYCFELNGLLGAALRGFGFSVRDHLARVMWGQEQALPRTHFLLSVEIDKAVWLVDAGFGAPGPTVPLLQNSDAPITHGGIGYRVRRDPLQGTCIDRQAPGRPWAPIYGVTDEPEGPADFEAANLLAALWDGVPFRHYLIASRMTEDGLIALRDLTFTERLGDGQEQQTELSGPAALIEMVQTRFGIRLSDALRAQLMARYRDR